MPRSAQCLLESKKQTVSNPATGPDVALTAWILTAESQPIQGARVFGPSASEFVPVLQRLRQNDSDAGVRTFAELARRLEPRIRQLLEQEWLGTESRALRILGTIGSKDQT